MRVLFIQSKYQLLIVLLLWTSFVISQSFVTASNQYIPEFDYWTRDDFIDYNINKVSLFSYKINKKGKIKRDSLLLYEQNFDSMGNRIYGVKSHTLVIGHEGSRLVWENFQNRYNSLGKLIEKISNPRDIKKKTKRGFIDFAITTSITEYFYDSLDRGISEVYKKIDERYSIQRKLKDTISYSKFNSNPRIYHYEYNNANKIIKSFKETDSTQVNYKRNYPKRISRSVYCDNCHSKYLFLEKKYDSNGNLKENTSYTREGLIHSKTNYYYNSNNTIANSIDSTGWYLSSVKPYWNSVTIHKYTESGKTITKLNNSVNDLSPFYNKIISYYDKDDVILKECSYSEEGKECTEYTYKIEKNKLVQSLIKDTAGILLKKYFYNEKGLISQVDIYVNNKKHEIFHYFYELNN